MNRLVVIAMVAALAGCAHGSYTSAPGYIGTMTMSEQAAEVVDGPRTRAQKGEEQRLMDERLDLVAPAPIMLASMVRGRLPRLELRPLVMGAASYSMDQLMRGSVPGGSGYLPCSSGTTQASWTSFGTCWNDLSLGASDTNHSIGWANYPATGTNMLRYVFGDNGTGFQGGNGDRAEVWSYHGIILSGGRASTSAPSAVTGSGTSDVSVRILSSSSGGGLAIDNKAGVAGSAISWTGRQTPTISFTIGAQSCGDLTPGTVTGAVLGAECVMSTYDTSGAANGLVSFGCGVTSADHVGIRVCNPSTSSITVTSKTYSYIVFNP